MRVGGRFVAQISPRIAPDGEGKRGTRFVQPVSQALDADDGLDDVRAYVVRDGAELLRESPFIALCAAERLGGEEVKEWCCSDARHDEPGPAEWSWR